MRQQIQIRKSNKFCSRINRSVPETAASFDSRFGRDTSDNGNSGYRDNRFDESIVLQVDDAIAKANAIRLLDAIVSGNRMEILDAAMNMSVEDATRLRNQIRKQPAISTPIDQAVIDAANFAVEIIERNEIVNTS